MYVSTGTTSQKTPDRRMHADVACDQAADKEHFVANGCNILII